MVHELPDCRLVVQMPSPDEPLLCLMPCGWKARDFLKPVADSFMVKGASVSSQPMFNMATQHSMSFELINTITTGEGHKLPSCRVVIQMPSHAAQLKSRPLLEASAQTHLLCSLRACPPNEFST